MPWAALRECVVQRAPIKVVDTESVARVCHSEHPASATKHWLDTFVHYSDLLLLSDSCSWKVHEFHAWPRSCLQQSHNCHSQFPDRVPRVNQLSADMGNWNKKCSSSLVPMTPVCPGSMNFGELVHTLSSSSRFNCCPSYLFGSGNRHSHAHLNRIVAMHLQWNDPHFLFVR